MCTFCDIAAGRVSAEIVYEDERTVAFLDHRPVFPGHTLLIPRAHLETLSDLPREMLEPIFAAAQLLARTMEVALDAHGSFVGMNNKVSQSVPHFHVHIVPRRRKDGLRGFFWPRHKYRSDAEMKETGERLRRALTSLQAT